MTNLTPLAPKPLSDNTAGPAGWLGETIARHKAGAPVGVYSVCSAHPTIVEAAIAQAAEDGSHVLIEATSNQVDQFGGYTGLRPNGFRDLVHGIADQQGFPRERVVLGGDHLGPNRWQRENADAAIRLGFSLPGSPIPWVFLAGLPRGPELSVRAASVGRDVILVGP